MDGPDRRTTFQAIERLVQDAFGLIERRSRRQFKVQFLVATTTFLTAIGAPVGLYLYQQQQQSETEERTHDPPAIAQDLPTTIRVGNAISTESGPLVRKRASLKAEPPPAQDTIIVPIEVKASHSQHMLEINRICGCVTNYLPSDRFDRPLVIVSDEQLVRYELHDRKGNVTTFEGLPFTPEQVDSLMPAAVEALNSSDLERGAPGDSYYVIAFGVPESKTTRLTPRFFGNKLSVIEPTYAGVPAPIESDIGKPMRDL